MRNSKEVCRLAKHVVGVAGLLVLTACAGEASSERSDDSVSALAGVEGAGEQGPGTPVPAKYLAAALASSGDDTGTDPAPAERILDYRWFGQENGYFCGPGSTRMALGTWMANPPSQDELGVFMGTTVRGTNHVGLPADALNKWIAPKRPYVVREMALRPTQQQRDLLKKDILARVGSGWPIVANVISGWRPAGYPSGDIYHYVTIVGYSQDGATVLIADPAAEGSGGPRWSEVPQTYWVTIENLGTWIGGKGYTG